LAETLVVEAADERLVVERRQARLGLERLEQRAGVVGEHVGHLLRGEPRLHDVVAVAALRAGLDLDRDVRVLLVERVGQRLGRLDGLVAVVDQERELDALSLAGAAAAVVVTAAAADGHGGRESHERSDPLPRPIEHHPKTSPTHGLPHAGVGNSPRRALNRFNRATLER
jgi:hypothetical protein